MSDERDIIVPFRGEEYLSALLLGMVIEHCAGYPPEERQDIPSFLVEDSLSTRWLNSYDISANAEAMLELAGQGLIEIAVKEGTRIFAKMLPAGEALMKRLHRDKSK